MEQIQNYISILQRTMDQLPKHLIREVIDLLKDARLQGKQVFIMGNGGSASTASHFACDLAKNTRHAGLLPFRVIGLTDNMALFSAYANDEGYENVFSQQLVNFIEPGDVVIAISASGNSQNVINAIQEAQKHDAVTIAFTGFDGGHLGQMVNINLHVQSDVIEHVEDLHLMLEHLIVRRIKEDLELVVKLPTVASQLPAIVFRS